MTMYIMITVLHFFVLRLFHTKFNAFYLYSGMDVMALTICSFVPFIRQGQLLMLLCQNIDTDELLDMIFFVKKEEK